MLLNNGINMEYKHYSYGIEKSLPFENSIFLEKRKIVA